MKRSTMPALAGSILLLASLSYALGLPSLDWTKNSSPAVDFSSNAALYAGGGAMTAFSNRNAAPPNDLNITRYGCDGALKSAGAVSTANMTDVIAVASDGQGGSYASLGIQSQNPGFARYSSSGAQLWLENSKAAAPFNNADIDGGGVALDGSGNPVFFYAASSSFLAYGLVRYSPGGGGAATGTSFTATGFLQGTSGGGKRVLRRLSNGNYAATATHFSGGNTYAELVFFDSNLNYLNMVSYTAQSPSIAQGLAQDVSGDLWMAVKAGGGGFFWKLDASGNSLAAYPVADTLAAGRTPISPVADPNGGVLALRARADQCSSCGLAELFKVDASGSEVWAQPLFNSATTVNAQGLALDGSAAYVAGVDRNGGGKLWLQKLAFASSSCPSSGLGGPSGIGKSRLAPVPLKKGDPLCLYYSEAVSTTKWEVFAEDQTRLATLDFGAGDSLCWSNTHSLPTGVYFIKVTTKYASGGTEERIQKITVVTR